MGRLGDVVPLLWGQGWFPLTGDVIDEYVEPWPGCYMLGQLQGGVVVGTRTGQSGNLNERLKSHSRGGIYDVFRFEYLDDVDDEALNDELLGLEEEIYRGTHGVLGLHHGEKEPPKRRPV
jgi:hypothetical protein